MISDGISEGHLSERTIDSILEKVLGRSMKGGLDFDQFTNVVDMLESHEEEEEDDEEEEDEEEDEDEDDDDEEEEEEDEGG